MAPAASMRRGVILLAAHALLCAEGVSLPTRRAALRRGVVGGGLALSAPRAYAARAPRVIPTWDLGGGVAMPTLALNTVGLSVGATARAVECAVGAGIGHVDFHPGAERDGVARALARLPRSSLFLTTKVDSLQGDPGIAPARAAALAEAQLARDRAALGVARVDLWLLRDHPSGDVMRAQWAALEAAKAAGAVRAIGVVNYCEAQLDALLARGASAPAVNYYMLHVGMGPDAGGLRSYGERRGVRTFAYGALGEPGPSAAVLGNPALVAIAGERGASPERVALAWLLRNGVAVSARPTAEFGLGASACRGDGSCAGGLADRAAAADLALSRDEMAALDALRFDRDEPALFSRTCNPALGGGGPGDPLLR